MSQEISAWESCSAGDATSSAGASARAVFLRNWPVFTLLSYFAVRLVFFAVGIAPSVPPDEVTHFGKSMAFSHALLLPENSAASYEYGLVTNIAWLYYWVMGKLLLLNFFGMSDLVFLRLCNVPLAFCTVYYIQRMLRMLTDDPLAEILLVALITNTLMFSFLSASVSYDNLANPLAAMALFYLFHFMKEREPGSLALSLLCQLAGCLTKITFLPLALVMGLLLVAHEGRRLPAFPRAVAAYLRSSGKRGVALCLAILLGVLLNLQLYGGNYLRYKALEVETYDVLPLEHALKYRLAARAYIFEQFRQGRIGIEKAQEMSALVNHEGDRRDTMSLIHHYADVQKSGEPLLGLLPYTAIWVLHMMESTFGIKAHLGMSNHGPGFIPLALFMLAALAAFAARWRPARDGWLPAVMAAVWLGYAFFLMYKINYGTYQVYKELVLSVAGRYMFPVIGPLYVLASCYLMRLFGGRKARVALLVAGAVVFIAADFPFFLSHATPEWFSFTR